MRNSTWIILAFMAGGIAVLSKLGFWQLDRLEWKEGLIARIDANLVSKPVSVDVALAAAKADKEAGVDYRPVTLTGEYVEAAPIFEFTTFKAQSGWNVYSLLKSAEISDLMIINRGFIPFDQKPMFEDMKAPIGVQIITGLLRSPPLEKPSGVFANDLAKREFYWRDVKSMAEIWEKPTQQNYYIDNGIPNAVVTGAKYPTPGTTIIKFPNSHLQYAFTWFGIALTLLGVGSYFLYSRRNSKSN